MRRCHRSGPVSDPGTEQANAAQAQVTFCWHAGARAVPDSFLGISTEYWSLPLYERRAGPLDRVLSMLRWRGEGPLILRVGGVSADRTFWDPSSRTVPKWVFRLTPGWFRQTRVLVQRLRARLILDLNLVTDRPPAAARLAHAAERQLPRGSIIGFEVGNEPDLYERHYWLARIARGQPGAGVLPLRITAAGYVQDFDEFAHALALVAPGVALVGPALGYPRIDADWISTLLAGAHPGLQVLSGHMYRYSACAGPRSASYPTIARLLSENATAGIAKAVRPAVTLAERGGLPFRLTELNSVSCGGLSGVSNSFATALWAPDALFELLQAGVDGVNVHVRTGTINAAFAPAGRGLIARPLLYGLVLFARTLGPGARLVPVGVRAPRSLHLKVWAVRLAGAGLRVLLIDKSRRSAHVRLELPASGTANVQRLLAPSANSLTGITLNGQRLGSDGRWHGRPATETITSAPNGYELTVPRLSAALVSVPGLKATERA